MKKVVITGSTGMVGKSALLECLDSDQISEVLVINRSSLGLNHPKLKEILLSDLTQIDSQAESLKGYDAFFHCMGVSVVGLSEAEYNHLTFEVTQTLADTFYEQNSNGVFIYVSGSGTDSSEKGSTMWARVKGKTENYVLAKGLADAYMFRPGVILPEKGIKSRTGWYNAVYVIMWPFFPLMRLMKSITTTTKLGQAMIHSLYHPTDKKILENSDINELAKVK